MTPFTIANNDMNLVVPELRIRVGAMIARAAAAGLHCKVFEGLRTQERQNYLYGQGRTGWQCLKAGIAASWARPGAIVTWTTKSQHILGKAVDMVFLTSNGSPSWSGDWDKLIEIGVECGLTNLRPTEMSHFQIS